MCTTVACVYTCFLMSTYNYLKGTIVCEYYIFVIFATEGENTKISTNVL